MLPVFAAGSYATTEINLAGAWDYCLLSSEKEYPPPAGTSWSTVRLPNRNLFELIAEKRKITRGYILYRKTVTIDKMPADHLVFQAGEIMNADIVFVNGRQIGKTGEFPPRFRSGWSQFRSYAIPDGLLVRGENRIEVLNYFNAELWFISPIRLIDKVRGDREYMFRDFIQVDFIHAFYFILLTLSTFFVTIYFKRKKEVMYLYYALVTFFLADMTILQFVENLYPYLPLSSDRIYKICGLGPMFFPPNLAFFFRSYLGLKVSPKRIALYLLLPCACALMMLFSADRYYIIFWRNIFLLLIPLYIAEIVLTSVGQLVHGNRKGLLLFISLVPIFGFGIYDILVFSLHSFEGSVPLYPIGVPFMVILIGGHLINRFVYNLNNSERLNILLSARMEEGKRLASLENEISIARQIQLANVPNSLPELNAFTIGVKYIPADNISGDFYNFHAIGQEGLGVLIADVSGHGVPASLIASMVKILFSTLAPDASNPESFIGKLNAYLFDKMEGNFLTAGYCYINWSELKARYARAGHESMLHIVRNDDGPVLHEYTPPGRAIGLGPDISLKIHEFSVVPGDRLILFTDGLTEACNDTREIFGYERLKRLFISTSGLSVQDSIDSVYNAIREWNSSSSFDDDFTLIIIDIK